MSLAIVSTCNINQWALDFTGNLGRIRTSIAKARAANARFRVGPDLEVPGYGCEDHFHEPDTFTHSWEVVAAIIAAGDSDDMLLDIGVPVRHRGVAYNCRLLILNREILLIRPKICLTDTGNYRESRWFAAWDRDRQLDRFTLPQNVAAVCRRGAERQTSASFGLALVELEDGITIGSETCEELWSARPTHVDLLLAGAHIISNGSASHYAVGKQCERLDLITSSVRKVGGVYLYSNQIGCDGSRLFFDGSSCVSVNGDLVALGAQFSVATEVEVVAAVVDLSDVDSFCAPYSSRRVQAQESQKTSQIPRIRPSTSFRIQASPELQRTLCPSAAFDIPRLSVPEELAAGPACWLWDYLRRSGMSGFFLPLSGGADSSAVATAVGSMCQLLVSAATDEKGEDVERLRADIRRTVHAEDTYIPTDARELAGRLLHTLYMGVSGSSTSETRARAERLAKEIGGWHGNVDIGAVVEAVINVFLTMFGKKYRPRFRLHGGTDAENLALQNVAARVRMVVGYLFAQLALWARGGSGGLLVLGSTNMDESLRGNLTKHDCSSADINPIGGLYKSRVYDFLKWAATPEGLGYGSLREVITAPSTAELEPLPDGVEQSDEKDMGITYDELKWFGKLRGIQLCGPVSMYRKLRVAWRDTLSAAEVAERVKFFFQMYSINRHKMTTLAPAMHTEDHGPDDNRFDLRQFLYNSRWTWQFSCIDDEVCEAETSQSNGSRSNGNHSNGSHPNGHSNGIHSNGSD